MTVTEACHLLKLSLSMKVAVSKIRSHMKEARPLVRPSERQELACCLLQLDRLGDRLTKRADGQVTPPNRPV